jgi:hypothetical protein
MLDVARRGLWRGSEPEPLRAKSAKADGLVFRFIRMIQASPIVRAPPCA